ncbi:TetR/AcrR family transcriptional regulator [Pseudonocardia nematodicida]|uniref:TetR/AcrR family transcriptional regulator n=1 Tax=Pseudonocardia nematodicida TaxID=1206997 RepID=A0ABV1K8S8_9PSEU
MSQSTHRRPRGDSARTRAALLEAAREVFAERGYEGASVDDIARVAGVSVGSIYSRFGNKETLFRALVLDHLDGELALTTDRMAGRTALQDTDAILRETGASRARSLLDSETWVSAMRCENLRNEMAGYEAATRAAVAKLVAVHRAEGAPEMGVSDEEFAGAAVAMFHGLVRQYRLDPGSVAPDAYSRMMRALARGLAAEHADRHRTDDDC